MICPNCNKGIHESWEESEIESPEGEISFLDYELFTMYCPICSHIIIKIRPYSYSGNDIIYRGDSEIIYPQHSSTIPDCPMEVPEKIRKDFIEACLVKQISINAAGALFRRCLQHVIEESLEKVKPDSLYNEIGQIIDMKLLAPSIADDLDYLRAFGNASAHPIRSKTTGEIVEIGKEEVEWSEATLRNIFDQVYVIPKLAEERRKNAKNLIAEITKGEMRKSQPSND